MNIPIEDIYYFYLKDINSFYKDDDIKVYHIDDFTKKRIGYYDWNIYTKLAKQKIRLLKLEKYYEYN